ncbi:DMT family transporter [Hoeflea prorocentri]|uniref:DMT family transporter n=1 Tax=Hoeflea prorocentri TaxID=1922333 RepID=A0A9X3ZIG0_9HYPH|nr:DMT family transporter [Hoeflea prorocentri]MCY6381973.1 DMT family transporter [Hoeflea prorocentri]MDA5399773.1 DMT family transporter [Hoeflea prorocentri]
MISDRPLLGIVLMLGFCILAPLGDSIAKLLSDAVPLGVLLAFRFLVQTVLLLPLVIFSARNLRMSKRVFQLMVLRTVLHIFGIGAMFAALRYLPLADAVAIAFVMPFIMLLLGKFVLSEEVGPHRLAACAVGFIGTLLVIQPNFAAVGAPALLPLLVAVIFSFFMLVTRQIAKEIDPISLQFSSGAVGTALLALILIVFQGAEIEPLVLVAPSAEEWFLLVLLGIFGTLAHLLMTWSLRFAPSATLAPMQYLEIPFATLIGWFIFRDLPNGLAAVGIAITVGAGLYVIHRERMVARRIAAEA